MIILDLFIKLGAGRCISIKYDGLENLTRAVNGAPTPNTGVSGADRFLETLLVMVAVVPAMTRRSASPPRRGPGGNVAIQRTEPGYELVAIVMVTTKTTKAE